MDIYLDREDKMFFGMIGPVRIARNTAEECAKEVRKKLQDYTGLEWKSFIVISHDSWGGSSSNNGHSETRAHVELSFHRLKAAKTIDGTWTQLKFEDDVPSGVYHYGKSHYMHRWYRNPDNPQDDDECVIPYTEAAWNTLNQMVAKMNELSDWLDKFTKRKDLAKLLNNPKGIPLLGAGK